MALEAVHNTLVRSPSLPKKTRQRTTQLKLAGIATFQPDAPEPKSAARSDKHAKPEKGKPARMSIPREQDELLLDADETPSDGSQSA